MKIEYRGTQVPIKIRGKIIMTENKRELIKLILENDNPEQALMTAAVIIFEFLKIHESVQEENVVCQQALCQTNPSYL